MSVMLLWLLVGLAHGVVRTTSQGVLYGNPLLQYLNKRPIDYKRYVNAKSVGGYYGPQDLKKLFSMNSARIKDESMATSSASQFPNDLIVSLGTQAGKQDDNPWQLLRKPYSMRTVLDPARVPLFSVTKKKNKNMSTDTDKSGKKIPLGLGKSEACLAPFPSIGVLSDVQKFFSDIRSNIGTLEDVVPAPESLPPGVDGLVLVAHVPVLSSSLNADNLLYGREGLYGEMPLYLNVGESKSGQRTEPKIVEDKWPQYSAGLQPYSHSGIGR